MFAPAVEIHQLRQLGCSLHPSVIAQGQRDNVSDRSGSSHPRELWTDDKLLLWTKRHNWQCRLDLCFHLETTMKIICIKTSALRPPPCCLLSFCFYCSHSRIDISTH